MKAWFIEPRDSLLARDGRPTEGGAAMVTVSFPWPSTLAGFVRTRAGLDERGNFTLSKEDALKIAVRGPLLAGREWRERADGPDKGARVEVFSCYAPAPADAVWFELEPSKDAPKPKKAGEDDPKPKKEGEEVPKRLHRLAPGEKPDDTIIDDAMGELAILDWATSQKEIKGKASSGPAFWRWDRFQEWLLKPPTEESQRKPSEQGLKGLVQEERTHVAVAPDGQTAEDGKLFRTKMLRFAAKHKESERGAKDSRIESLSLVVGCDDPRFKAGLGFLGGERRVSFVEEASVGLPAFPSEEAYKGATRLRVVLLTPAIFEEGWKPKDGKLCGAKIVAAAVKRPEVISGWDMTANGGKVGPKKSRRVVPAGSVYWVEVPEGKDAGAWAKERWMTCVSDAEQDRLDGFGLCAVGRG
jgi:CRISPR-associated protein Cmr3